MSYEFIYSVKVQWTMFTIFYESIYEYEYAIHCKFQWVHSHLLIYRWMTSWFLFTLLHQLWYWNVSRVNANEIIWLNSFELVQIHMGFFCTRKFLNIIFELTSIVDATKLYWNVHIHTQIRRLIVAYLRQKNNKLNRCYLKSYWQYLIELKKFR